MINSIKLENIATYASVEFSGLQRQNFIYGSNGSGKTTLSNYLADSTNLAYSDCSTIWENDTPLEILVYNKNFRQKHFNSTGKIPGIFTIGEKSQEIAEQIEAKNKELESLKTNITTYKSTQGTKQDEIDNLYIKFKDNVWDRLYKKHEKAFKEAFKGVMSNKDNFVNKVLSEYETHKNETALDYENLKKLSDKIYNSPNEKFSNLPAFPSINLEEVMQNPIYSKKIIGNNDVDIAPLINRLNNSDWVNVGRSFLGTNDKICPFCQQETISDKFIKELASFFDETYTKDLNTLKETSDLYKINSKNLLDFLDEIEKSQTSNNNTN
ncbi:MAG: AAA family ATPase [Campylobacter sp.]|nr:AAA family ATPase [Campylobacter sp.]